MPFKVFTVGEIVTAADVNDYLMEQAVISCTSGTRPSSPNEGMVLYLTDVDRFERYTGTVWVSIGGQYVGEAVRTSNVGTFTTTETVTDPVTVTASGDSSARWKVTAVVSYQSTVAGDIVQLRLRWKAGGTLDATGTEFDSRLVTCDTASKGNEAVLIRTVTGISAGSVTLGVTAVRNAGTGNILMPASASSTATVLVETA